jgi:DNA polymerase-3 subunit alpha
MSFVGLHIHSAYSLLDGASQLPQLVERAKELGMPAIALTDRPFDEWADDALRLWPAFGDAVVDEVANP